MDDNTYQFDDVETGDSNATASNSGGGSQDGTQASGGYQSQRKGGFAKEIHSITHHAAQRTFYFDLRESERGQYVKVTERSRGGKKSTVMLDLEDLDHFINALKEIREHSST